MNEHLVLISILTSTWMTKPSSPTFRKRRMMNTLVGFTFFHTCPTLDVLTVANLQGSLLSHTLHPGIKTNVKEWWMEEEEKPTTTTTRSIERERERERELWHPVWSANHNVIETGCCLPAPAVWCALQTAFLCWTQLRHRIFTSV